MKAVLLDTNIVSFIFKNDSRVKRYKIHLEDKILTASFMIVAELFQWSNIRGWGDKRRQIMELELKKYIVFPYDIDICRLWGSIRASCAKIGQPTSSQDARVASCAVQHDLPLVTHNPKDFRNVKNLKITSVVP